MPADRGAAGRRPAVDVLIPTYARPTALAATLGTLVGQTLGRFRVVVADQTDIGQPAVERPEIEGLARVLRASGRPVELHRHLPRRGMAEQRAWLLAQARAPYALFLDDDVACEPHLLHRLLAALRRSGAGFVGSAVVGLSFVDDVRPHEQAIEFWPDDRVDPEVVRPGDAAWTRHVLHNAANLEHARRRLRPTRDRLYKVAWVGGCVLYDTARLRAVGGFDFWPELPQTHAGEDVLAQLRVMARFGGAGLFPSGAYHLEADTTLPDRPVDAPIVLPLEPQGVVA